MWAIFALGVGVAVLLLFSSGYVLARSLGLSRFASIGCSAPLSLGMYSLWATALSLLGIACSWLNVFLPVFCMTAICYAVAWRMGAVFRSENVSSWQEAGIFAGYIAVALLVTGYVFVGSLDGADSFVLSFDNAYHLSRLEVMVGSGNWATVGEGIGIYYDYGNGSLVSPSGVVDQGSLSGFYPSAWHIFTAMISDIVKCPVTVASNVSVTSFLVFAYPAGMFYLSQVLFPDNKWARVGVGVCAMVFVSFQWILIEAALFPNLVGMCLIPAASALFIDATRSFEGLFRRMRILSAFSICLVALALSQPNCLFTLMVFLVPYCLWAIGCSQKLRSRRILRAACLLAFVALVVSLWVLAYHVPFMQSVIYGAYRPAYADGSQALVDILTLAFRWGNAQLLLGALVVAGAVLLLLGKGPRWLLVSYVLMSFLFFVGATRDGFFDYALTGFWYTDQQRVGAAAALFAVPLAGASFGEVARCAARAVRSPGRETAVRISAIVVSAICLVAVLYPNFHVNGWGSVETAFGRERTRLSGMCAETGERNIYSGEERAFVEQVKALVGDEDAVLNIPVDGSAFSFGQDHLNVYYRSHRVGETEEGALIRKHLSELADNPSVQEAVASTGIKYVMLLDYQNEEGGRTVHPAYDADEWVGVNSITEDTPGFELVLSQDDMRLYKIDEKFWAPS